MSMPERVPLTRDEAERGVPPVPFTAVEWEALHRASATYAPLLRAWAPDAGDGLAAAPRRRRLTPGTSPQIRIAP